MSWTTYIFIACLIITTLSLFVAVIEHSSYMSEKYKNDSFEMEIASLKNQAEKLQKDYDAAKKQAVSDMIQSQQSAKVIYETKISPDCKDAIKFGITEAQKLK